MSAEPIPDHKLQVLLKADSRGPDARKATLDLLADDGVALTGEGTVSLSVRVAPEAFDKLFTPVAEDGTIAVPHKLKKFVESITEAPRHLRF